MPRLLAQDMKASLAFDGVDDSINVTNGAGQVFNNTSCTVAVRVKIRANSPPDYVFAHQSTATNNRIYLLITSSNRPQITMGNASVTVTGSTLQLGVWYDIVGVYDRSTPALYLYVNGVLVNSVATGITAPGSGLTDIQIGSRAAGAEPLPGNIAGCRVWNRIFTATEVALHSATWSNPYPASTTLDLPMQEGAGTTANDYSGNNNHGTITGATFSSDTPTKKRKTVGENLISNGDFEYVPPFVAATSTSNRWIDGTAAGSTTAVHFGWALFAGVGTRGVQFDTAEKFSGSSSLKVSTLATGSLAEASTSPGNTASDMLAYGIPVIPGVSYTCTYRMKTAYTSGDSSDGACVQIKERTAAGSNSTTTTGTKVKTTTDWTQYSVTFVAGSTARFVTANPSVIGNTGAATLIMDAWFDDIRLTPTVNPTTRPVVLDYKASLKTTEAAGDKIVLGSNVALTGEFTASFKMRLTYTTSTRTFFGHSSDNSKLACTTGSFFVRVVNAGSSDNTVALPRSGEWVDVTLTRDSSNKVDLYVNDQVSRLFSNAAQSGTFNVDQLFASTGASAPGGYFCDFLIKSTCLTAAQVAELHRNRSNVTGNLQVRYPLGEGAGTTANDTSGNANHGTITSATFSADVPSKKRELVGGNLVKNGDFEYAPPFTAVGTTVSGKFIDGTSSGSVTNKLFGWAGSSAGLAATYGMQFDSAVKRSGNYSLKLSTDATGVAIAGTAANLSTPAADEVFALLPNTAYTLTLYAKSDNARPNAVFADVREYTGGRTTAVTNSTNRLSGTQDWTVLTVSFTTGATTRYGSIILRNQGVGNISDAWFDDIFLQQTTLPTRALVS